ncbi:PREDICTED: uncharacterized protein LOC109172115 [Ipomoea nil]|uniref:uncharacterized protein LOC109172115 n=1 Tax=Ipomoea nil TaxID=35883 RepID=UPI000900FB15|nr:PREDICTED: uncharacterized protein LOC109172115 [Ipomoea nil]
MANTSVVSTTQPEPSNAVDPSGSRSLGSVDTYSDEENSRQGNGWRRDTGKRVWVEKGTVNLSNLTRNNRDSGKGRNPPQKDPFHNHRELEGDECLLHGSMAERGRAKLDLEDWIEPPKDRNFPLMGRFAGKFPGMRIIDELAKTWGVWYNLDEHYNGHVMFWFKTEEDRDVVLKKGPFAVYGKRMFLEPPPKEFSEAYEDYRFLPMWVRLPSLPKPCWNTGALSKIAAAIGKPLYMDQSTLDGRKIGFARVLVDVDCSLEPLEHIAIEVPDGSTLEQNIFYQNWVPFCTRGCGRKETDEAALVVVEDGTGVQDIVATPLQQPFGTPQVEVQSPPPPLEIGDEAANETSDAEIPQVEVQSPPPPPEIEEEAGNDKEEAALSKSARRKARKARKAAEAALNPPCNLETVSEVDPDPQAENEEENVVTLPIEPSRVVAGARRRSPQSKKQKKISDIPALGINKVAGGGVWDFVWNNKLSVIALLETKLSIEKADLFVKNRKNGWKLATNFHDTVGGRILVTWNPALVDCSILETGPQHVHCLILCKISQKKILCTFVYGLFSVVARRQLWEKIEALGLLIVEPWVISGDFNTVLSPSERRGGNEPTRYELQDLENCCANMDLTDCPSTGKFFTWRNRYMEAKLDRVLINDRWGANGLTCMADFKLLACNSDHCPVVITTSIAISDGKRPFKFLNMWLTHQDFKVTLENVWREHVEGSKQYILAKKLKSLKGPLRTLNRNAFSHISERTRVAKEAYSVAQDELDVLNANEQERAYVNDLRKRALFLMEAERRFFAQKLNTVHLVEADKGSHYFHSLINKRNAASTLAAILDQDGNLTTSLNQVGSLFVKFFSDLFGTPRERNGTDNTYFGHGSNVCRSSFEPCGPNL